IRHGVTVPNQGNGSNDSDADRGTGLTSTFSFNPLSGDNLTLDAGLFPAANIGDLVWIDEDGDGIKDGAETGLSGVTVILYNDDTAQPFDTVTTDINGNYTFENVPSGNYYVVFDASTSSEIDDYIFSPTGAGTSDTDSDADASGTTSVFAFDATAGDKDDVDAGIIVQSDIGDYVWLDADGDGVQDNTEVGVANVEVQLFDNLGTLLETVFTDSNGEYKFENRAAGTYFITFDAAGSGIGAYSFTTQGAGGNTDSDADATGRTADFVFDPLLGDDLSRDAGLVPSANIGDYVWFDADRDGIQDVDETTGIENVTVRLVDANTGTEISNTTTNAAGAYNFNNVAAGDYYITFDTTTIDDGTAYLFAPLDQGNDSEDSDASTNSGNTAVFSFDPLSGNDLTIDAGLYPVGSIGDYVWLDSDEDGIQDGTESGLEGVTVTLYDNDTGLAVGTTTTDGSGAYLFEGVPSGDYYVVFDPSTSDDVEGYAFSGTDLGGDDALDSDADDSGSTAVFSFDPTSGAELDVDAGVIPQGQLGDYVWNDTNQNGIQDATETGIANVKVRLLDNTGTTVLDSVFTDINGGYNFDSLTAGDYIIEFVNDPVYEFTTADAGNDELDSDANITTGRTTTISFDPTTGDDFSYDAGLVAIGNIGDYVWLDTDQDGIQDATESGIEDMTVNLYDADNNLIGSTTTDVAGAYLFTDVPTGDYYITFDTTTIDDGNAYVFSPLNAGNGSNDSDVDAASSNTAVFSFDPLSGNELSIDAGLYPVYTIGDYVWVDTDGDGVQDGGESGLEDVTVTLYDNDTGLPIGTTTTDASGNYTFE
ncbi:MAG: SdrD B-like domain-containing protein, partial [Bacteroidota bacterium]